jgi:hypothetical protein
MAHDTILPPRGPPNSVIRRKARAAGRGALLRVQMLQSARRHAFRGKPGVLGKTTAIGVEAVGFCCRTSCQNGMFLTPHRIAGTPRCGTGCERNEGRGEARRGRVARHPVVGVLPLACLGPVGSEEAHPQVLASVRRTNCTCGFPAHSVFEHMRCGQTERTVRRGGAGVLGKPGLVRHRQTKGAGTDRPALPPWHQCSTLPPAPTLIES